jgi:hypothetical protein
MDNELKHLLRRSIELEQHLLRFMQLNPEDQTDRTTSSRIMCGVGFEHAESVKILIASGNFTSATSLLRLQYEALVRAMWLQYAASDVITSRLMGEFTHEKAKKADRLSMMTQMLQELESVAPSDAMRLLLEFKEHSWKPLSSYVHGGIHVLHRHSKGYPVSLIQQTVRSSNSVSTMLAMHLARMSHAKNPQLLVPRLERDFADCLLEHYKIRIKPTGNPTP